MSAEEFMMSLRRHFSHNVVCFPAAFPLLASTSLVCFFCFTQNKIKKTKFSLPPFSDTFKTKGCSKLALQPKDYCAAFTQSK